MCHLCEERSYDGFRHLAPQEAPDGKTKPVAKAPAPERVPPAPGVAK